MKVMTRLAHRLRIPPPLAPVDEPAGATLESFFAGVRWSEDTHTGGRRTLRRSDV